MASAARSPSSLALSFASSAARVTSGLVPASSRADSSCASDRNGTPLWSSTVA
ncbi:hypothetical protein SALBM311S_08074 [Streptomyces alboniger]